MTTEPRAPEVHATCRACNWQHIIVCYKMTVAEASARTEDEAKIHYAQTGHVVKVEVLRG